jgi:mRNA-degrading endonuclease HigB of HigAB toxin-antitoxin module
MIIWDKKLSDKYASKHSGIADALQRWTDFVEEAEWKSHNELKIDFP